MTELARGDAVIVRNPIAFGGGTSHHQDKKGTVKKVLSARQVLVDLGDGKGDLMFFTRELELDTTAQVS